MARVVTTELDGHRTCGRPRIVDSASWADDTVLQEDCPGYIESEPVRIVREEVIFTFADNGGVSQPGFDANGVERSTVRYLPADGNWRCPHCDFETCSFDPEPRTKYMSRSDQHVDELRRRSMRSDEAQKAQVTAAERQALALEALARQGEENGRVAQLEAELAELRAMLAANGAPRADEPGETVAPRAARPKAKA